MWLSELYKNITSIISVTGDLEITTKEGEPARVDVPIVITSDPPTCTVSLLEETDLTS